MASENRRSTRPAVDASDNVSRQRAEDNVNEINSIQHAISVDDPENQDAGVDYARVQNYDRLKNGIKSLSNSSKNTINTFIPKKLEDIDSIVKWYTTFSSILRRESLLYLIDDKVIPRYTGERRQIDEMILMEIYNRITLPQIRKQGDKFLQTYRKRMEIEG